MGHRSCPRPGRPARFVPVEVIRKLHRQGYSFRAIARTTGLGYGTVRRAFHGAAQAGRDSLDESPPADNAPESGPGGEPGSMD